MKETRYVCDTPQLMDEWDFSKNTTIQPSQLSVGSSKKVWWHGACGHSWEAIVKERTRGYGCPICAGKRIVVGINDLESNYPELAIQWDHEKNQPLSPKEVTAKSGKSVWWLCEKGHSYKSPVCDRTEGRGCPFCKNKRVSAGQNDLASQNPVLAKEFSSNNEVGPDAIFVSSHRKVWWTCSRCKHEWQATVDSRNRGNGCPACAARTQSSFPEQAVFFYIQRKHPDAISRYTNATLGKMELDTYIPSLSIGVEYDGKHWHRGSTSIQREQEKYRKCKELGITLIRMRESEEIAVRNADYVILLSADINADISRLSLWDLVAEDIDVQRDCHQIMANYLSSLRDKSFAAKHPHLVTEWCYEKNNGLTPDMFTEFSTQAKLWWQCRKGHQWQSTIASRTSMGSNCPYCSNRKLLRGYNDFLTTNQNPELLNEWDYSQNDRMSIFPYSILAGSKTKVWWKCSNGHTWQATISSRIRGNSCPICSNHRIQAGENDLASVNPQLALEWDFSKNAPLLPTMVSAGSDRKVWWKCQRGHEWSTIIRLRSRGNGCPYCSGKYVVPGETDLGTTHPHLLAEWNYEKNPPVTPSECSFGSQKKEWWICRECGHEWQTAISDRTHGHGCPACAKRKRKK